MNILNIKNYHHVYRPTKNKKQNAHIPVSVKALSKYKDNYDDVFKPKRKKKAKS